MQSMVWLERRMVLLHTDNDFIDDDMVWYANCNVCGMRKSMAMVGLLWYGMVCKNMVCYGMLWYDMLWYGLLWYGMQKHGMLWYAKTWYATVCESKVWLVARLLLVDSDRWESGPGKGQPCILPRALLSCASLDRARLQTISHNGCNISQTGTRRGIVMAQRKGLHVAGVGSQGRSCACKGQPPCIKSRGTAHLLLRISDPEQTLIRIRTTLIPMFLLISYIPYPESAQL